MINNKLSQSVIAENKQEIIRLLRSIQRDGIEFLISELDRSGFFTEQPHHTSHHEWVGGLAQHSLGAYKEALRWIEEQKISNISDDSLIIVCLLHDLCKVHNLYPEIHKQYPKEHGMRSVRKLNKMGFKLRDDEAKAIKRHMHHDHYSTTSLHAIIKKADGRDAEKGK